MTKSSADIPDQKEREEALDPGRSFIVQAPAGSGKTELLIRRFLKLLSLVDRPEQIVAITFTRKAAGEMHCRIMNALENARYGPPPPAAHDRERFDLAGAVLERDDKMGWNLLENSSRLKVQTIDSLCSSLTRQMPILSRLGKEPNFTDNPEEIYKEAARRTIALVKREGRDGEAVRQALRHLDNSFASLEKRLIAMLAVRDQWLRHVNLKKEVDDDTLREYLEGSIRRMIEDSLKGVMASLPEGLLDDVMGYGRYAASNLILDDTNNSSIKTLHSLTTPPGARYEDLPVWRGIRELLLTGGNEWRKSGGVTKRIGFPADKSGEAVAMKEGFRELLDSLAGNDGTREGLAGIADLPDGPYDEREWAILNDLLHLLPLAERELMKVFAENGVVDFQAVSMAALESLGSDEEPTDLMLALDIRIKHILVDEYQDTSRTQLKLLEALTRGWEEGDGRTLFIVGDPMQSIYLFREAEVGLFLEAREEGIGTVRLKFLRLKSNFRSQKGIIDWVNGTFRKAFPEREDRFSGSIRYEDFEPVHERLGGEAVTMRIFESRADEAEAKEIIDTIRFIKKRNENETIAILARSRSHLGRIVETLKFEEIDFRATDLDPLIERPAIQDLFALLRVLMHPCDRTAWLAILRAPWCGLTLKDIHSLCMGDSRTVWELIGDEEKLKDLSGDGRQRLLSVRNRLEAALPLWGRMPPRRLLEGLWAALGGPACIDDDSMDDADAFFEMVESVTEAGGIESLETLKARTGELYATHSGKGGSPVEVLTIHRAKGLEYDHVIIPGMGKSPRLQEKKLLRSMERGAALLLAPIEGTGKEGESAVYRYLARIQSGKEQLEQVRLLYVAATRAKKRLYLYGHAKGLEGDEIEVEAKSFLSSIRHIIRPDEVMEISGEEADLQAEKVMRLKRLPAKWAMPEPPEILNVTLEKGAKVTPMEKPEYLWAGETIKHLGTVMHRYFCRIAREGIGAWTGERTKGEKPGIAAQLRQLGLTRGEALRVAAEGVEILCRTLEDRRGRWILDTHREGRAETALSAVIGGEVVHRVIDRTFVDEDDARWVIDYKISRHGGGDIKRFLESERERYREQLEGYATILEAGGEKRKIRKGLYYPAQSGWIQW